MSTQSPEPWVDNNRPILTQANWNRARDCVNGCAGLNPAAYRRLVELVNRFQEQHWQITTADVDDIATALAHAQEPG